MYKNIKYLLIALAVNLVACDQLLSPEPIDKVVDELALTTAEDIQTAQVGLYSAFRSTAAVKVVAGDFTADFVTHRGTFAVFRELGTKQIPATNAAASALWASLYNAIYVANFIFENLPKVKGATEAEKKKLTAEAKFIRGLSYFIGASTYGGIPKVTTTDPDVNRNIPKATKDEILDFALADLQAALPDLPVGSTSQGRSLLAGYATQNACKAALARFYLYRRNWTEADKYATEIISSGFYNLKAFPATISADFDEESIFEVAYTNNDDPGTSTFGLNNVFLGRREVTPTNQLVILLNSRDAGARAATLTFNSSNLGGTDNGWSVAKYGTPDEGNNNIVIFRLGEMYLIRAEARAQQGKITEAAADLNVLRQRAALGLPTGTPAPTLITGATATNIYTLIEQERVYELAFEGHRWYDLVRTQRAQAVMSAFSPNWTSRYELWPIPQTEIQRNPALANSQNPGY
jgi:starch-binding outer membrane protein, SusD/RagB family